MEGGTDHDLLALDVPHKKENGEEGEKKEEEGGKEQREGVNEGGAVYTLYNVIYVCVCLLGNESLTSVLNGIFETRSVHVYRWTTY